MQSSQNRVSKKQESAVADELSAQVEGLKSAQSAHSLSQERWNAERHGLNRQLEVVKNIHTLTDGDLC